MDRRRPPGALYSTAMPIAGRGKIQLLLSTGTTQCHRLASSTTCRRDLYRPSTLRLKEYHCRFERRRTPCQSQESPGNNEGSRNSWNSTWATYLKATSRAHKISISPQWDINCEAHTGMEYRHHLYPPARGFCVPLCRYGLVQSTRSFKSPLKYTGRIFLHRCLRRGCRSIRHTGNFQYGSRGSIQLTSVCRVCFMSRNKVQYGWKGPGFRQCIYREIVEVIKI